MCIIAIDTETEGLDARKFVCGCVTRENGAQQTFWDKTEMWAKIIDIGAKEEKRQKNVYAYAHNHEFDFYSYGAIKDPMVRYLSFDPFIASRRNITFLDTVAITRCALKDTTSLTGMKKSETPEELKNPDNIKESLKDPFLKDRIEQYMKNDTMIVMKIVQNLKDRLEKEGTRPRRLISAGQIAASLALNHLKAHPKKDMWLGPFTGGFRETADGWNLRKAYRGGRVEARKTGAFKDATMMDINSLYPWALATIPFPDLRQRILAPDSIIPKKSVGAGKMLIWKKAGHSTLGVRMSDNLVFPRGECLIYGSYTFIELEEAMKNGARLLHLEDATAFPATENPFTEFVKEKYKLREESEFDKGFWKLILNNIIGKMAQSRERIEVQMNDIGFEKEMKQQGFELKNFMDDIGIYQKKCGKTRPRFFCPLIPAYTTALSRIKMHRQIQKMDKDMLYGDTDSILYQGDHDRDFDIGKELGQWKKVYDKENALIYGKKSYSVGASIKMAGTPKAFLNEENFKAGKLTYKRMVGLRRDPENAGRFEDVPIDMTKTRDMTEELNRKTEETVLFIDEAEKFPEHLKEMIEKELRG